MTARTSFAGSGRSVDFLDSVRFGLSARGPAGQVGVSNSMLLARWEHRRTFSETTRKLLKKLDDGREVTVFTASTPPSPDGDDVRGMT